LLKRTTNTVISLDISREALRYGKEKYGSTRHIFIVADARFLPFRAEVFDGVTAFEVIEHLSIQGENQMLDEVNRVQKKEVS
jgi:ubiquinone/menaquinone biosynthesis C-methylase UbiE